MNLHMLAVMLRNAGSLSQSRVIQHTQIALGSLNNCKWREVMGSCNFHTHFSRQLYFEWEEETNHILLSGE